MAARVQRLQVPGGPGIVLDWYAPDLALGAGAGSAPPPAAVFVHGLGSHRRGEKALHFAEGFNRLGWGFLALDLRAHGESGGSMRDLTVSGMLTDLGVALDWLAERAQPRLLIGSSMGGMVAAWRQLLHPLPEGRLVLIAPALRFPTHFQNLPAPELEAWRQSGVHRLRSEWIDLELGWGLLEDSRQYAQERLLAGHRAPTLILHGMQDGSVPWQDSLAFAQGCGAAQLELLLLKGGDHRLTAQRVLLLELMAAWLRAQGLLA